MSYWRSRWDCLRGRHHAYTVVDDRNGLMPLYDTCLVCFHRWPAGTKAKR